MNKKNNNDGEKKSPSIIRNRAFIIPKAEYKDLKSEFFAIADYARGKALTKAFKEEIYYKYKDLFDHFNLRDLQFKLIVEKDDLQFKPIRAIDEYAIKGILEI